MAKKKVVLLSVEGEGETLRLANRRRLLVDLMDAGIADNPSFWPCLASISPWMFSTMMVELVKKPPPPGYKGEG